MTSEEPLSEHLEALKKSVAALLFILLVAFTLCWVFSDLLFDVLVPKISTPYTEIKTALIENPTTEIKWVTLPEGAKIDEKQVFSPYPLQPQSEVVFSYPLKDKLLLLSPLEGFFTSFKIAFWSGVTLTCPIWLYILFQFISPALHIHERKLVWPLALTLILTGFLGFFVAHHLMIPTATQYFYQINASFGENFWSLDSYIDYTLMLYFCTILLLELVAILILFIVKGVFSHEQLASKRKVIYLVAFILGAFLSPPQMSFLKLLLLFF